MKKYFLFVVLLFLFVSCDKDLLKELIQETQGIQEIQGEDTQTSTTKLNYTPQNNEELKQVVEHEINAQGQSANLNNINTSNVTNMDAIFIDKTEFNGDVSQWDTSQVTSMKSMFHNAHKFDGDVSEWNVSKVEHMNSMFENAKEFTFKGDISKWDVGSVENMNRMFANASVFNKDLSVWETKPETSDANILVGTQVYQTGGISVLPKIDTSLQIVVTSKEELKAEIISAINSNGIDVNLNYIDTSQITDMSGLFENMTFNGDISRWDTSKVTNMSRMFKETSEFNGDISRWDTGEVRDMSEIFADNQFFNTDISAWDTKNVTTMNKMFYYSIFFSGVDKDLGKWDTGNVEDMSEMFRGYHYIIDINIKDWNVSKVKNMSWMFGYNRVLEADFTKWDTSSVEDMSYMFYHATHFNEDVKNFNTSKVKDMRWMFARGLIFNQDLSGWDTSNVEYMDNMFLQLMDFYQDLSSWDISSVKSMTSMFERTPMQDKTEWFPKQRIVVTSKEELKAEIISAINSNGIDVNLNYIDTSQITDMSGLFENMTFKGDISRWDTSKVTNMSKMFKETSEFDGDISRWDTGEVRDMSEIFANNKFFRSDIGAWDTKNVTTMRKMFYYSTFFLKFRKDLGKWDTGNVEDMSEMFRGYHYIIDINIKDWDVSKVKNMSWMFGYNYVLEADFTKWDTSNVEDMSYMFYHAYHFNEDVKNFNTSKVKDMRWMFARGLKFNQDLSGWDMSNVENIDYMFLQLMLFYQNLSSWDISSVKKMYGMFERTPMQDKTEWFPKKSETISQDTLERMIWISEREFLNWCTISTRYSYSQEDSPPVTTVSPPNPETKILVFDSGKFYYGNLTDFQYDDCPYDTEKKINRAGLIQLAKNASAPNYTLTDEKEISYVIDGNSSKLNYGTDATLTVAEGEVAGKTKGTVFYILK